MQFVKYLTLFSLTSCLLQGCATHQPPTFDPLPFDQAEYDALPKTGTGIIQGQVFAKTIGGDVKKGAGNNVILIPATKYGTLRYNEQVIGGKLLSKTEDPRYAKYVLRQVSDGDGKFIFRNVPAGKYYAVSHITWEAPSSNRYIATETQGGQVRAEVFIQDGKTIDLMLKY